MGTILEQLPAGARVAAIRLRSLGDCVLTTPALALLREARGDLKVAVVVEERFKAVFEGNPDVDELLGPSGREIVAWRPELSLNLHGGTRSMALTARSGARFRAGFAHHRYSFLYNVRIPTAQEILGVSRTVHTAEHLASAVFYLGAPQREIPRAKLFAAPAAPASPYAALHPKASAPDKTWAAERFAALAARLRDSRGLQPVFIAGPGEDLSLFAGFRTVVGAPLAEVKSLIAGASLFVGNDSGPAHMAAALGVPSVVIFGASEPEIWRPWKAAAETLIAPDLETLTVDQVWAAAGRLKVAA